jgi:hypothetical protein
MLLSVIRVVGMSLGPHVGLALYILPNSTAGVVLPARPRADSESLNGHLEWGSPTGA